MKASSRAPSLVSLDPPPNRMHDDMARSSNHVRTGDRSAMRSLGSLMRWVITLSIAAPGARVEAQTLNFRQYTAADGLPQAQVMGMYQDRLGYMWFATYGGLSRFDGGQFRT